MALLLGLLAGCADPTAAPAGDEIIGIGGASPEQVVQSFIDDMNLALKDPSLTDAGTRRIWAERLAGYFAPSERRDQRAAMGQMLLQFADSSTRPAFGSRAELSISYSGIALLSSDGQQALVEVTEGALVLRWRDAAGEVVRERSSGLMGLLGQEAGGLPTIQVNGRWFLTEG